MDCNKCGAKLNAKAKFCNKCGTRIMLRTTNTEELKKTNIGFLQRNRKIQIAGVAVLMLVAIGFFWMNYSQRTEAITKEIDQYLETFDECFAETFYSDIALIVKLREKLEHDKNFEDAKNLLNQVQGLVDKIQNYSQSIVYDFVLDLKSANLSRAYQEEIEEIKRLNQEIEEHIKAHRYISAKVLIDKWQLLIDNINAEHDNYELTINQIDTNEFPKIRLYFTVTDKLTGNIVKNIDPKFVYLSEKSAKDMEFLKQTIEKFAMLDHKEALNTNLVVDVSDSMAGIYLNTAKQIIIDFLDNIQFDVNDKVELTVFADYVSVLSPFTNNRNTLKHQVQSMRTQGLTALYDAIFAAVNSTAAQVGAKCVIVFTDGRDNRSNITPDKVIEYAQRYKVPVFIIGIGDTLDTRELNEIASKTGGLYKQIRHLNELLDLYQTIYRKNKEMYVLEYTATDNLQIGDEINIHLDIQTRENGGNTAFDFRITQLISSISTSLEIDPIAELLKNYLYNFVNAMNNNDYSYIEDYLVPGGGVEKEVKPYIMKDFKQELLAFELIDKQFIDAYTCIATTRETYKIQNNQEPLHMRVLEGKYEIVKQADGRWRIKNFADLYKILSKINY